jgi:mannose-6-phosphate isomerase-like protein (cupin superfamily)
MKENESMRLIMLVLSIMVAAGGAHRFIAADRVPVGMHQTGSRDQSGGYLLGPDEGEPLKFCDAPELRANIKVSPATTDGKAPFAAGTADLTGSNTGRHTDSDEIVFFYAGSGTAFVGETKLRIQPGVVMYVPKGVRHGFASEGAEPVRFFWINSPPGIEERFRAGGHPPSFECKQEDE